MEIAINLISIVIPIGIIAFLFVNRIKKTIEETIVNEENKLKMAVEAWLNSETGHSVLYQVGGLVAAGAKHGFGLTKKGGKGGLEGMITELIGGAIKKKFGLGDSEPAGEAQQPKETFKSEF